MRRLCCMLMLLALPAHAANVAEAIDRTQADTVKAVRELDELRSKISSERLPLAEKLSGLENDVARLREERSRLQSVLDSHTESGAETELRKLEEQAGLMEALLQDYRRSVDGRASAAEVQYLKPDLDAADASGDPVETGRVLLSLAKRWNRELAGGLSFGGECLDRAGRLHQGEFSVTGPLVWFAGDGLSGLASTAPDSLLPSLLERAPERSGQRFPVDVTGGKVLKVEGARGSWPDHLKSGGFVMLPLLLLGALAVVIIVWKTVSLRNIRPADTTLVRQIAASGESGELMERLGFPAGPIIAEGLRHRHAPPELLEEIMYERMLMHVPALERHLGTLAVIGGVAPLLGLLGTVTGMIHTFRLVTLFGSGEAHLLSGGISEALVTTETGLVIAIPVLIIHAYFHRRVKSIIAGLELMISEFARQTGQVKGDTE
ncbi:MAG: MotA/TolQ/ExbB proton channel family protein [Kiritimatiellae bacterium]|nr:MotA/TolQ/ExbB proton channel family protein [Kiritimatiellia bacterium]